MKSELAHEVVREVLLTADVFLRESRRLFRRHGLTAAQYNVLNLLATEVGGLSQRQLGDLLVVDRSNVTGLVDRLEKAGWVRREDDPRDRRIYRVSLTPLGRRLWGKIAPDYGRVVRLVSAKVGDQDARTALGTLRALQAGAVGWRLPDA